MAVWHANICHRTTGMPLALPSFEVYLCRESKDLARPTSSKNLITSPIPSVEFYL